MESKYIIQFKDFNDNDTLYSIIHSKRWKDFYLKNGVHGLSHFIDTKIIIHSNYYTDSHVIVKCKFGIINNVIVKLDSFDNREDLDIVKKGVDILNIPNHVLEFYRIFDININNSKINMKNTFNQDDYLIFKHLNITKVNRNIKIRKLIN